MAKGLGVSRKVTRKLKIHLKNGHRHWQLQKAMETVQIKSVMSRNAGESGGC